jgi:hypothetical protein
MSVCIWIDGGMEGCLYVCACAVLSVGQRGNWVGVWPGWAGGVGLIDRKPGSSHSVTHTHMYIYTCIHAHTQNTHRCSLHRKLDMGELFVVDSGPMEASFIVASKAKSFVCQVRATHHALAWHGIAWHSMAWHNWCFHSFSARRPVGLVTIGPRRVDGIPHRQSPTPNPPTNQTKPNQTKPYPIPPPQQQQHQQQHQQQNNTHTPSAGT